jgi:hypothetical protein
MKARLLSYKPDKFQALNSTGFTYILEVERFAFFGLFSKVKTIKTDVPHHESIKSYQKHWDELIKSGKIIKL